MGDELRLIFKRKWADPKVRRRVLIELYAQIPVAFGLMIGCYLTLMLFANQLWQVALLLIGMTAGAIVMGGLFHDSNHAAVFKPAGLNRKYDYLFAWLVSDVMLGMSSYHWRNKHDRHHTDANILGLDEDIEGEPALRFHPAAKPKWFYRYQHIYAWFLYPLMLFAMHIRGHNIAFRGGNFAAHNVRRAKKWEMAGTVVGLLIFYAWAVAIPIWLHGWTALYCLLVVVGMVGFIYALAFQSAHAVDLVKFLTIAGLQTLKEHMDRALHQFLVTANYCTRNWAMSWIFGGLTHQVEHHAERGYPHPFYRQVEPEVRDWCQRWGVPYNENPTAWSALKSHWRHLHDMGHEGHFVIELDMD